MHPGGRKVQLVRLEIWHQTAPLPHLTSREPWRWSNISPDFPVRNLSLPSVLQIAEMTSSIPSHQLPAWCENSRGLLVMSRTCVSDRPLHQQTFPSRLYDQSWSCLAGQFLAQVDYCSPDVWVLFRLSSYLWFVSLHSSTTWISSGSWCSVAWSERFWCSRCPQGSSPQQLAVCSHHTHLPCHIVPDSRMDDPTRDSGIRKNVFWDTFD